MNWRKHLTLIVGGGIALILLVIALIFLLRAHDEFQRVNEELSQAMRRLERLTRRDPYPSPSNIQLSEENLAALRKAIQELQAILQRGQVRPEAIEAAEFAPLLERASKRLYQRAAEAGVLLPERFTMGLSRYAAGELPARDAIPRLVVQLKSIDAICQILFQSRIHTLLGLERIQFDAPANVGAEDAPSGRGGRRVVVQEDPALVPVNAFPMPASNTLYEVERISVSFLARDAAVWEVLNALARTPLMVAVADVRLANVAAEKLGKATPLAPLGGDQPNHAPALARYPSHEERIVAGRELVQAALLLDVYRLVRELDEEAP